MAATTTRLLVLVLLVAWSHGARRVDVQKRMSEAMSNPIMRRAADLPTEEKVLGLQTGEHLVEEDAITTSAGTTKVKLQETYEGVVVVGESVVVEKDTQGLYTGAITGKVVEGIHDDIGDVTPSITVEEALAVALQANGHTRDGVTFNADEDAQLEVDLEETASDDEVKAHLVYKISYFVVLGNRPSRPITLVDAKTGALIKTWEGITGTRRSHLRKRSSSIGGVGGNEKMGKFFYGKDFPGLEVRREGDICYYENEKTRIVNLNNTWGAINDTFSFNCSEGFDDAVNGGYSPLNDILFYTTVVYDMFTEWYDMKPLKSKIQARVHCGHFYENAFWDGRCITFGDGNATFYPLTNLDVTAHEIAHGVTEQHSGLIYYAESGGLNEAFSDMAGETAESFLHHKRAGDYKVGYEIGKSIEALRYMDNPTKDNRSIAHADDYCPGIDVHLSSGVFNKVFSILTRTEGWCARTVFGIFLMANRLYWTPNSVFSESACGVVQAAKDLGKNPDDVIAAFRAVGIEPCVRKVDSVRAMHSLKSLGEDVKMMFDVPEDSNHLSFNFQKGMAWMNEENVTLTVRWMGQDGKIQSQKEEGQRMQITPQLPLAAQYEVTLSTKTNFTNSALTVTGHSEELLSFVNGTLLNVTDSPYDQYVAETSFEFPESVTSASLPAALTLTGEGVIIIRHGTPVDVINYEFDSYGWGTLMLCRTKPGTYYVSIWYYQPMGENTLSWNQLLFPNPDGGSLPAEEPHFGDECKH